MTNYRVRQVLALGAMPDRQLRFLIALATWLPDDTRTVRVGFDALIRDSGNTRNTVRRARRELESAGKLGSQSSRGRGHLTLWTAHCLPEKGVNIADPICQDGKGVNPELEKGSTGPEKRVTYPAADQQEPERGLNRTAKESGSLSSVDRAARRLVDCGGTEKEIRHIVAKISKDPKIKYPGAYLAKAIDSGDALVLLAQARQEIAEREALFGARETGTRATENGARSNTCRQAGHKPQECGYGDDWCTCSCHDRSRKRGQPAADPDEPQPIGALIGEVRS